MGTLFVENPIASECIRRVGQTAESVLVPGHRAVVSSQATLLAFDITKTMEPPATAAAAISDHDLPAAKLLLVDDRRENHIALRALLEPLGHDVVSAMSGEEALKRLLADDFAAILLDVQMPGIDGFETATLIKQRERSRYIPILFITAIGSDETFVVQAYSTGAVDYIRKPCDPFILRSKIAVFVDLYQQREQIRRQADLLRDAERREMELRQEVRDRQREHQHLVELAERERQLQRFKMTLDATLDGVFLFDPNTLCITYANQGVSRLLGRSAAEMRTLTAVDVLADRDGHLTDGRKLTALLESLNAITIAAVTFETAVPLPTGAMTFVEVFLQYVPEVQGPGNFVCLVRDITERRQAEADKAALGAQLDEMALKQRTFLREVLSGLTEGRLRLCDSTDEFPEELDAYREPVVLSLPHLRTLRLLVAEAAREAGWPRERIQDFETAVGEAAMNAVVHGRSATGTVRADLVLGAIQVWIRDEGTGIAEERLHRATLERGYSSAGTLGHGFWIMLKTCDRVYLLTSGEGTTVVLEQGKTAPLPGWMQELSQTAAMSAAATK
jgi:PAS domain S-box-containing protein